MTYDAPTREGQAQLTENSLSQLPTSKGASVAKEVVGSSGHQVDGWCSFKISFIKAILYVVFFWVAIGTP